MSPRRARALAGMAALLFATALVVTLTVRAPQLPHGLGVASGSLARLASQRTETIKKPHSGGEVGTAKSTTATTIRAEIKTCPACRLNALPKVKAFVHGDAKLFPGLKVTFEFGHDPILYLYDESGGKKEEFDLGVRIIPPPPCTTTRAAPHCTTHDCESTNQPCTALQCRRTMDPPSCISCTSMVYFRQNELILSPRLLEMT